MKMLLHDLSWSATKRRTACQQEEGHHSQRILVAGWHRQALPLLRGHIDRGAAYALAGKRGVLSKFRKAKVRQENIWRIRCVIANANQKIVWLDVLVENMPFMGVLERVGSLEQNLNALRG